MKNSSSLTTKPLHPTPRIAIVVSHFNIEITTRLLAGATERLRELSTQEELVAWVPGAIEIPLATQHLAKSKKYDAIITFGAVIRGETTHYDYVCQQVSQGCQQIALENHIPVIFGILTTENIIQALERVGGKHGHKGYDAVDAAFHMINLLRQLS